MSLVRQRDSKYLNYFINAAFQFHIVLYDCNKTISNPRSIGCGIARLLSRRKQSDCWSVICI